MTKKKQLVLAVPESPAEVEKVSTLDSLKSFFKYSETIFIARIAAFGGFVTAVNGQLDLAPLWSLFGTGTEFTWKQVFWIGLSILGAGVTVELARRRNMKNQ